ncbi:CPBP family intramembrane glutamic endopeptidase [Rhodocaloribacter sp.]
MGTIIEENPVLGNESQPTGQALLRFALRIIRFPLTRILIAVLMVGAAANVVRIFLRWLYDMFELGNLNQATLIYAVPVILAVHVAYVLYVHLIERRPASELAMRGMAREAGVGLLIGGGLFTVTVALLWVLGFYELAGVNGWIAMMAPFAAALTAGYVEEIFFRGILFRILEEGLGSWLALALSSTLFGLMHAANPGATLLSTVAIVLEAGILLGTAFMMTRRLWLAMGLHFSWNFVQGGIFGINVSGFKMGGLFQSHLQGPDVFTGGAFGAEASVIALTLCLLVSGFFILRILRKGEVVKPLWKRGS